MTKQTMKVVYLCCSIIQFLIIYLIVDVMVVKRPYIAQATLQTDDSLAELALLYGAEKASIHKFPDPNILEKILLEKGIIRKKDFIVVFCFQKNPCLTMELASRNFKGQFQMTKKESWEFKKFKLTPL